MKQMFAQFRGDNLNGQGLVISTGQFLKYWIKMGNTAGETSLKLLWSPILVFWRYLENMEYNSL